MRAPLVVIAGSLLMACSSGTRIIYVPAPATAPAPTAVRTAPAPQPPVGVNIVRVDEHRLQVSTNQPAYLAVFEIVPYRGVTLVYPANPRQRQVALTGTSWLNVAWRSDRGANDDDERDMRRERRRAMTHHIYAIASERPLRLTDGAYDDVALRGMLGVRVYLADDPYETMTALSRRFVPPQKDEDWGEDVYTMDVVRPAVVRVAKIYCPDGSVMYVRDEMAERAVCPNRGRGAGPDSVVASNGQRVARRMEPGPSRIFRVPANYGQNDNGANNGNNAQSGNNGANNGNNSAQNGNDNDSREKSNNGNHYGWDKNKNDGKDKGNNGNNGAQNGNNGNDDKGNNGNHYGQQKGDNGNNGNKEDIKLQGRTEPQRPSQPTLPTAQPMPDPKPVAEPAHEQPKAKDEPKVQEQPKPQEQSKPQEQPKAQDEPKAKPENKGMRGVMDRMREKAQADSTADAKDKKAKP